MFCSVCFISSGRVDVPTHQPALRESASQSVYIRCRLSCIFTEQRRHYSTLLGPEKLVREPPRADPALHLWPREPSHSTRERKRKQQWMCSSVFITISSEHNIVR